MDPDNSQQIDCTMISSGSSSMSEGSEEANGMPHCVPLGPPIFWNVRISFQNTLI